MDGPKFDNVIFITPTADLTVVVWIVFALLGTVALGIVTSYLWQRYCKFRQFQQEMNALGLNSEQEGTLSAIVRRYRMHEPIDILLSEKLFDELASKEMVRILSSPASAELKDRYIRELYEIRDMLKPKNWNDTAPPLAFQS